MPFENVKIIDSPLHLATPAEVGEAESRLKLRFPPGYREYVTLLGDGAFCQYVRVWMPSVILTECKDYQTAWNKLFAWNKRPDVLPAEKVVESIIVADTYCGDEIVFHPDNPNQLFLLPPDDEEMIDKLGNSLDEALDRLCNSSEYEYSIPTKRQYFVPQSWYRSNPGKSCQGDF